MATAKSVLWKIIQFPLVRIVIAGVWLFVIVIGMQTLLRFLPNQSSILISFFSVGITLIVTCLSYYAFVRIVEKRRPDELKLKNAGKELACGILVGTALLSASIEILWFTGYYVITDINPYIVTTYAFLISVWTGVFEEILFRAVVFRILEEWIGSWIALLISALVFGLIHLSNPGSSLLTSLAIALEAGVLLGAGYILTRRLWFVIGLHFSWNFVQGGIFGVNVSGVPLEGILQSTLSGPELLTGGSFGVEASIVTVTICTIAGLYVLWKAKRKGNFIEPFWKRKAEIAEQITAAEPSGSLDCGGPPPL